MALTQIVNDGLGASLTATSEGGAVTTSIQQGLAKAWFFTTDKTAYVPTGSINVSSITDNAVARPETNFTNNFNDTNVVGGFDGGINRVVGNYADDGGITTSSFAHYLYATQTTTVDPAANAVGFGASYLGDLA